MRIFLVVLSVGFWLSGCACKCGDCKPKLKSQDDIVKASNTISLKKKVYNLLMCMENGTQPPIWIAKMDLKQYMESVVVYYDGNLEKAKESLTKREPCKIDGQRRYDTEKFFNFFGYRGSDGTYSSTAEGSVAIFTKTPVRLGPKDFVDVNILNVIWPNFEDQREIDAMKSLATENERKERIREMFRQVFSKIKARYLLGDNRLVMVGEGSVLDKSVKVVKEEFGIDIVPILNEVYQKTFAGSSRTRSKIGRSYINGLIDIGESIIKAIRGRRDEGSLESNLFVIPSTQETLLGNGNRANKAPEGIIGRRSAISILGWTITNPLIRFVHVPTSTPTMMDEVD